MRNVLHNGREVAQRGRLADSNPMHLVDVAVYFPDAGPLKQTRPTEARSVKSKHNPVHANCQSAESILPLGLEHC